MIYGKYVKRIIDFTLALFGFILLSPILVVITLFLFLANDGKPFFCQLRPGLNGKIFKILKFKTMNDRKDASGKLLPDEARLTKIGKFVRKTSLDEIPQLLNVIKGDMSLIGPRPLLTDYMHLYNEFQNRRHEVRPGITGWAQVNGRNAISWDKKFEFDVWYVDHMSFVLDCKILIKTVQKVIKSEGINTTSSSTIEPFKGSHVILYGASGHCKVIMDILKSSSVSIKKIIDDNVQLESILGLPIEHSSNYCFETHDKVILSIGNNKVREKLSSLKVDFITAIHKQAIVSSTSIIDKGTVVMAGAIINTNTRIGKHCIINSGSVVEHDCNIEDFVHISPNVSLAGNVAVGLGSQIGIGATVIQGITIGKWVIVGAGAVIIKDIPDFSVVVGNPGKVIKKTFTYD
jgi:sugar O-acyltransferase (sialic acid O-acetyltransferase NeuD family)